jgi:hypothetical protein
LEILPGIWVSLEYKLNNLMPDEESRLLGIAFGGVALIGNPPQVGNQVTITLTATSGGTPVPITVTAGSTDTALTLIQALANGVVQNTTLSASGFNAVAPYGTGPFAQNAIPIPQLGVTNPNPFTITVSATGAVGATITSQGLLLPPSATVDSSKTPPTVLNGYLPILDWLEGAIASSTENLGSARADVYYWRLDEIEQRKKLYKMWKRYLSEFLGTPLNPNKPFNPMYGRVIT